MVFRHDDYLRLTSQSRMFILVQYKIKYNNDIVYTPVSARNGYTYNSII